MASDLSAIDRHTISKMIRQQYDEMVSENARLTAELAAAQARAERAERVNLTDARWLLSELDAATARAERAERAYLDIVAGDAKRFHFEDCTRNPDYPPNHSRDECVGGAVDMARAALAEGA